MGILTYCTVEEIKLDLPPDLVPEDDRLTTRLIKFASAIIRRNTEAAIYPTTPAGAPSDPEDAEAFRMATIAQVGAYLEAKLETSVFSGGIGLEPTIAATSANGASVTFGDGGAEAATKHLLVGGLCPEAWMILRDAGMLDRHPTIRE